MAKSTSASKKITAKVQLPKKIKFSFKQATGAILLLSIVLLGVSGWFWWHSIFTNPDRVLNDMLSRSLQTSSVTKHISQQDQQSLLDQSVRLSLSPNPAVQTVTSLSQRGSDGSSKVTTETIGTNKDDFVRYRSIESTATPLNMNALGGVLNVWSKRNETGQPPTFLNEALLAIVPFGNLKKQDRQTVIGLLQDKKAYSYTKAVRKSQNGRQVLVYEMSVAPQGLVEALAAYSQLSGLGEQPQLDPKAYASVPPVDVEMTIDILSRELVSIKYTGSNRIEAYHGAGLRSPVAAPGQTIAFDELQKRLQALQQN